MRNLKDDPSGKGKIGDSKERWQAAMAMVALGLCLGVVIAERTYVSSLGSSARPRQLYNRLSSATKQMLSSGATHVGAILPHTGAPRNPLEAVLRKVAPDRELLLAVANKNVIADGMLETFTTGLKRSGIENHLILALDQETVDFCKQHGVHAFHMNSSISSAQVGTGENHAVSAMKFGILHRFLELGYSVLLSDVDIVVLQDPFKHLYRDSDLEGMSDGFNEETAYGHIEGFDDPSMGWSRYAEAFKHFNMNSGLFFLRANKRTLDFVMRLETRLAKETVWDQSAYNEVIFSLSHDRYRSPQVSVRIMSIYKFMNSKLLFKDIRFRTTGQRASLPQPVMVHINYHPDKLARMQAVVKFYVEGDTKALDPFPGGSEVGTRRRRW